jgi:methionyl-tRNA formyltransferase
MEPRHQLNVALLALTGFGNTVLAALLADSRVRVGGVFTVTYPGPFPYYPERQLVDLCASRGVTCYHDLAVSQGDGLAALERLAPDLIVVATFKQMLRTPLLALPRLGVVNLHPSLLPRHRGPCPTQAALLAGDRTTGVTAHYVDERLDEGDILLQRTLEIDDHDDDGRLRQRLASLAASMVPDLVGLFAGGTRPSGRAQDHAQATLAPRPDPEQGHLERAPDAEAARRAVRALTPYPGASVLVGAERIAVDSAQVLADTRPPGIYPQDDTVDLVFETGAVRLFCKQRPAERAAAR